jgi:hypothetical protein
VRFIRLSIIFFLAVQPVCAANVDVELNNEMTELLRDAAQRTTGADELRQAMARYSRGSEKGKYGAKDIGLNYLGLPRGLDASMEGANLVLGQPQSIKNLEAAECGWQLQNDQLHEQLWAATLQLAAGLGSHVPAEMRERSADALAVLNKLVGDEEAAKLAESIIGWAQSVKVGADVFRQDRWDFARAREKAELVAEMAEHNDFTMIGVSNKLHHFSDHSRAKRRTSKLVEGTVSAVTMFGPGFGTPIAAQSVGAMWGVSNGGSEESKLLKELYYGKQLESRKRALRTEAELVLAAYQEAVREKNIPLLVCSEALLAQMVGAIGIPRVLEKPVLNHGTFAGQTIANTDAPL